MCNNKFSILKEFTLILDPFKTSEQMLIEDKEDVDMYFTFRIDESEESTGTIVFFPQDSSHGDLILTIKKGSRVRKTPPAKIGTYGKKSENIGLYVSFEVMPTVTAGKLIYQTFIQFQIKGGEDNGSNQ